MFNGAKENIIADCLMRLGPRWICNSVDRSNKENFDPLRPLWLAFQSCPIFQRVLYPAPPPPSPGIESWRTNVSRGIQSLKQLQLATDYMAWTCFTKATQYLVSVPALPKRTKKKKRETANLLLIKLRTRWKHLRFSAAGLAACRQSPVASFH